MSASASKGPSTAMVMAAGLGLRMRPFTLTHPKALVEVAGKALIDHMLDALEAAGVETVVVNVHAHADQLEAHLAARTGARILISDERSGLLDTGGGVKKARALLGEDPVWICNSDYVWTQPGEPALDLLAHTWDPAAMDACLVVVPKDRVLGFDTPGDFFPAPGGRLSPRGSAAEAPLQAFGIEILDPRLVYADPREAFSLRDTWFAAAAQGRLHGVTPDGLWMQVGDPQALATAEARLR